MSKSFAAYNQDPAIRAISSSGGVFHALAGSVIRDGGLVFGAAFDADWQVRHRGCETLEELPALMQSKYVQSAMGDCYSEIRTALRDGRPVLFCGTPCQVAGLLAYLRTVSPGADWEDRLITVDFICHGVPSPLVWRKYLAEVSRGRKIRSVNFRDKSGGWKDFSLKIEFDDGSSYCESQKLDLYLRGFLENLDLRPSCHACRFKGAERPSDFTIADFWGVQEHLPAFYDDRGTSIVMAHNARAIRMLESLSDALALCEISSGIVEKTNAMLVSSVGAHADRAAFLRRLGEGSAHGALKEFTSVSWQKRLKYKIKKALRH